MINFFELYQNSTKMERERKKDKDGKKSQACHSHCDKIRIFVQKFKFSITLFLAGKFKFTVGVD